MVPETFAPATTDDYNAALAALPAPATAAAQASFAQAYEAARAARDPAACQQAHGEWIAAVPGPGYICVYLGQ